MLPNRRLIAAAGFLAVSAASVFAQSFVNGNFETGDMTGWTFGLTTNGATNVQTVEQFDIDGPGPLGTSNAAKFGVGGATFTGLPAGITLTQSMNLTAGTQYTFAFNYAAIRLSTGNNAQGGVFDFIVNGTSYGQVATNDTSSTVPHYGVLSSNFTPSVTGSYTVGVQITRPYTIPGDLFQYVDNFTVTAVPEPVSMLTLGLGALGVALRRRRKA